MNREKKTLKIDYRLENKCLARSFLPPTSSKHNGRIAGVGATSDRCYDNSTVLQLVINALEFEFDRCCLFLIRNSKSLKSKQNSEHQSWLPRVNIKSIKKANWTEKKQKLNIKNTLIPWNWRDWQDSRWNPSSSKWEELDRAVFLDRSNKGQHSQDPTQPPEEESWLILTSETLNTSQFKITDPQSNNIFPVENFKLRPIPK